MRLVAAQCIVTTLAGGGLAGNASGTADGVGTSAGFFTPEGIAVDSRGNVFVADYTNNRVRAIAPNGTVTTLAGGNVSGTVSGSTDGVGTAALFNRPAGVAVDSHGTVYVVDQLNNKVRAIAPNGTVATCVGGNASGTTGGSVDGVGTAALFSSPRGIAVDSHGTVFVADYGNHRVRAIAPNGTVTTLAGGNSTGTVSGSIDGVGTAALFRNPNSVAVDSSGTVYVADFFNNKLRVIAPNGTVTTLAGGNSSGTAFGSTDGVGTAALFHSPYSIALDSSGNVYVADFANKKVRAVTPGGIVTTLSGGGVAGTTSGSADGVGTAVLFGGPSGVALDNVGNVFVADSSNHKIRWVPTAGAAGYFYPSGCSTSAQLCPPGHFCPAGSTKWNDKNCGRGNYCPWGSAAPVSCGPKGAVDAVLGPANGPAFMSDVAACRNHCYNGAPGQLSTCA